MELDSLYGSLLGERPPAGPAPMPGTEAAGAASPASAAASGGASPPAAKKKGPVDDIFSEPPTQAAAPPAAQEPAAAAAPTGPPTAAAAAAAGPSAQPGKEPSSNPLPQAFSAAKLMMPPVRKKAEQPKRAMPALDLSKLQAEKEALLRQRAEAKKDDSKPSPASGAGLGAGAGLGSQASRAGLGEDATAGTPATGSTASAVSLASGPTSLYGSPDEEYDPAKPNDYDEFCRRRMRQKAEEEMERRRQEAAARTQAAAKPPEQPKEDDFATRMMKKMGYKEGQGLGKDNQGMTAPLIMKKVDNATGVIAPGQQKREATQPAQGQPSGKQAKPTEAIRPPSKIVLLTNMVGAGEVDEDLEEETAEEAGKYGKLVKCVVKEIKGVPDHEAVRIFLKYETVEMATKAYTDLNGRFFGGRSVKARFFDVQRFDTGDLEKKPDE